MLLLLASAGLALCLALAGVVRVGGFWPALGLNAIFIFWVVLTAVALLCPRRGWLLRQLGRAAPWFAFLLIQLVVVLYSALIILAEPWLQPLTLVAHSAPGFFLFRNLAISLVVSVALSRYLALQQRWKEQVATESRAILEALQARIHPHFLFNALNTITSLIPEQPGEAEQATMDLSDLLRTGLTDQASHTLSEELELVRGYLRIESLRLGERLEVDWQLADDLPLDAELPMLLIQPLVENAVVHGVARLPAGGRLTIQGERIRRGRIRLRIENPLLDRDESGQTSEGNRMALDNVRQRLALAWEEGARLKTRRESDRFFVEIVLPIDGGRSA